MSYNVHNARHKIHKLNEAIAGSRILLPLPNKRWSPMPRPDNQVPSGCHLVFTRMESTLRLPASTERRQQRTNSLLCAGSQSCRDHSSEDVNASLKNGHHVDVGYCVDTERSERLGQFDRIVFSPRTPEWIWGRAWCSRRKRNKRKKKHPLGLGYTPIFNEHDHFQRLKDGRATWLYYAKISREVLAQCPLFNPSLHTSACFSRIP